jgi:hypothetical protein
VINIARPDYQASPPVRLSVLTAMTRARLLLGWRHRRASLLLECWTQRMEKWPPNAREMGRAGRRIDCLSQVELWIFGREECGRD